VIDIEALMDMVDGDADFVQSLITDFRSLAREQLEALEEAASEGAIGKAARLAHSLKGGAATVRARAVSDAAAAVETIVRDEGGEGLTEAIVALRERLDALEAWIDEHAADLLNRAQD